MLRHFASIVVMVAAAVPALGGKSRSNAMLVKLAPADAAIDRLKVPPAKQKCPNWAWAAGLELILSRQNVELRQDYWIEKASGGDVCREQPTTVDELKQLIDGEYVLDDGSKARFEAVVTNGAPSDVGYLVKSMKLGRPLLVFWNDRPLVLEGVNYDEYVYPNGQRMFELHTMTLIDPITSEPVTFDKGRDNPREIEGALDIQVQR